MASDTYHGPYTICLQGDNWFHTGWLYGVLGLPEPSWDDRDNPVRDIDIDAFREGMEMAEETRFYTKYANIPLDKSIQQMISLDQIKFRESLKFPGDDV